MPRPADAITHDEYLNQRYGAPGTPTRDALQQMVDLKVAGELLRQTREAQGLTQAELGERLGVGRAQISKLEKNVKDVRFSTIQKVFEALGMKTMLKIEPVGERSVLAKA